MKTLKALSIFLEYPTAEQMGCLDDLVNIIREESGLSKKAINALQDLSQWMQRKKLIDCQEEYVALFDRTPSLSLHLFEHVHGDSKDRGPAMVDLDNIYREAGLVVSAAETPDYLPLFLEFLSRVSTEQAYKFLGETVNIIGAIEGRLRNRKSQYAAVFSALQELADRQPDIEEVSKSLEKDAGAELDLPVIDEQWAEQFAFDNDQNNANAGCPAAEDMLKRMNIPSAASQY